MLVKPGGCGLPKTAALNWQVHCHGLTTHWSPAILSFSDDHHPTKLNSHIPSMFTEQE